MNFTNFYYYVSVAQQNLFMWQTVLNAFYIKINILCKQEILSSEVYSPNVNHVHVNFKRFTFIYSPSAAYFKPISFSDLTNCFGSFYQREQSLK